MRVTVGRHVTFHTRNYTLPTFSSINNHHVDEVVCDRFSKQFTRSPLFADVIKLIVSCTTECGIYLLTSCTYKICVCFNLQFIHFTIFYRQKVIV